MKLPTDFLSLGRGSVKKYTVHEYQNIERSITINKARGNIKLNLLTKETINETLSKIKNEKVREKIKYDT